MDSGLNNQFRGWDGDPLIPECPYPLRGRELLSKLQAIISLQGEGAKALNARPDTVLLMCLLSEEFLLTEDPKETMLAQSASFLQELQQKITRSMS